MRPADPPARNADVRRPTLNAVAALAGVGRGTVSRVINGSPKVSDRSRAAVQRAIDELGYIPNRAARSLVTQRTDSVALVVPEAQNRLFSEPYFSGIIRGVSAGLAGAGMQLLLVLVRDEKEYARLATYLSAQRVDGVLMMAVHSDDTLPDRLEELAVPTVLAGGAATANRWGTSARTTGAGPAARSNTCWPAVAGPSARSPGRWTWMWRRPGSRGTGRRWRRRGSKSRTT